jgi:hypothetical protein
MLRRNSEPLALSEASLLGLRPALNTPVLSVDYLPVGPARAAIVVFAEEYGGIGLALGIRSNEGGQVVVFRNQEPLDDMAPLPEVIEPALAVAERMGFLFDEDMVAGSSGGQRRVEAMELWGQLMGDMDPSSSQGELAPLSDDTQPVLDLDDPLPEALPEAELELNEISLAAEPEVELELESVDMDLDIAMPLDLVDEGGEPPSPPAAATTAKLSKFRQAESTPRTAVQSTSATAKPDSGSELGRIPLVRVRRRRDGSERIPFLARLLSSF